MTFRLINLLMISELDFSMRLLCLHSENGAETQATYQKI